MNETAGPPWPVAVLTGFLGSGKTTLVRRLLASDGMADTMVVVNEFGAVGIDHELIAAVHGDVVLLRGGCLCCGVRQDLARTLRDLHLGWRAGRVPPFARVVIETSGLAEPGPLVATLASHPLVCDAYMLRSLTTLVDGEYAMRQLSEHATCRRQVAAADRILIAKSDRAAPAALAALQARLGGINRLATMGRSRFGDADPAPFFAPGAILRTAPPGRLPAETVTNHLDGIQTVTLTADHPLVWAAVQDWLARLLDSTGERLLRLKGILDIDGQTQPVVVQAVHHSFYPPSLLPRWTDGRRASTLVLLVANEPVPAPLIRAFATLASRPRP